MSRLVATTTATRDPGVARPVSRPTDHAEREADQVADVVAGGGHVRGWSLASSPATGVEAPAPVRRDPTGEEETKTEDPDAKQYEKAARKTGEALLQTEAGKALEQRVLESPEVQKLEEVVTSPAGIAIGATAIAGGLTGLALTGRELPFQPPAIPLDRITPGLSAQIDLEGPLDAPTAVGLTITFKPKKAGRKTDKGTGKPPEATAPAEPLRPVRSSAEEQRLSQEAIDYAVRQMTARTPLGIPVMRLDLLPRTSETQTEASTTPVRRAPTDAGASSASASVEVDDALATSGRPLTPHIRQRMETRFGHDFGSVRLHDDVGARTAAAAIDARAFTVGDHIASGPGQDVEASPRLLAHELAHVVQQRRRQRSDPTVHRLGPLGTVGVWLGIIEGDWSERELLDYLDIITRRGEIDGSYDADNKARAIVGRWKAEVPGFDLLARQKILLIEEMLDGLTLGGDEEAILDLLEGSDASDLRAILGGTDGVRLATLEDNIHHGNRDRLDAFVARRFAGGRDALLAGRVEVVGDVVPAGAPGFGFDATTLDARFDSDRTADELIELVEAFGADDRRRALHHLSQVRRVAIDATITRFARRYETETDPHRRNAIAEIIRREQAARLKVERVLLHFLRGEVPTTEAELQASTRASDPTRAADIDAALRPPVRTTSTGTPLPFEATLPGETQTYEDKIRSELPGLVDRYHTSMVSGRGPTEHADPSRTHTLAEFESIGEVSRRETLAVFSGFTSGPPLRADAPGRRGNIHDRFTDFQVELRRMSRGQRRENARQLLFYVFQSNRWIRDLNNRHSASPDFDDRSRPQNDEARSLASIATAFVAIPANVVKLNEIDRNWDAVAQPETSEIWVQRFRAETPEEDRLLLWDMFQTLIHEYLHTLAHSDYQDHADTFGANSNEWNTLIEGVDSLLTEIVWDAVEPRVGELSLRREIEGPTIADNNPPIDVPHASHRRYASYTEALRLADIVGIRNVYAAYFLGLVDRIGGS